MQGLLNGIASLFIAALALVGFKGKLILTPQPTAVPIQRTIMASPSPIPTPVPTQTPNIQPAYSVTIQNQAVWGDNGFEFNAQVENLSVKPFITNLAFYDCDFADNINTICNGHLESAEVSFDKALSISDITNAKFRVTQASCDRGEAVYGKSDWTHRYRDTDGETITKTIGGVKIISCTAYISTNDKQASNGWGSMPIIVKFP